MPKRSKLDPFTHPQYQLSVARRLTGVSEWRLKAWEKYGLIKPARDLANVRFYSDEDLGRIRRIDRLLKAGYNRAGVLFIVNTLSDEPESPESDADYNPSGGPDVRDQIDP